MRTTTRWVLAYLALGLILSFVAHRYQETVLGAGGFIESLPALLWLVVAALSIVLALRHRRGERAAWPWLAAAAGALFLVAEEAEWGADPVFGVTLLPREESSDLHNWLVRTVGGAVPVDWTHTVAIVAVVGVGAAASLALLWKAAGRFLRDDAFRGFLWTGAALAILSAAVDFTDLALVRFYNRLGMYKWALEELTEIMAAMAILIALIVRLWSRAARRHS